MSLLRTPLFPWHNSHGARIVEFGGWEMPVQYSSIVEEHHAVRKAAGLFDISHMGRLKFRGKESVNLLNKLLTCRVDNLADGQVRYGLVCNESGGILDDVLVNRVNEQAFGLVVNASNRQKIVDWINNRFFAAKTDSVATSIQMDDETLLTSMLAVQGPHALSLVNGITKRDWSSMRYYTGQECEIAGKPAFVSRTGYTGEDGFELIIPNDQATEIWEFLLKAGEPLGLKPCGLGCRDTLRLEAAMPLYGHELTENIDPLTAGLSSSVKLDKSNFIGRGALIAIRDQPQRAVRVGLKLASRRIAREHSELYCGTDRIGEVTSGTFSPTLEQSIAMAYVAPSQAAVGSSMEVDIRGKREPAEVAVLPFYKRPR